MSAPRDGERQSAEPNAPAAAPSGIDVTVVLPAKNESRSLESLLPAIRSAVPQAHIIVVDDGSTDDTAETARRMGVEVLSLLYSRGNGAAVKAGARAVRTAITVFMDGDGQHPPDAIPALLAEIEAGHDMAVGARSRDGQASFARAAANAAYNRLARWMVGHPVLDLTSGFRAVRTSRFREFLHLLPNGFSYPTTITMAFFRAGYSLSYVPIAFARRDGPGHIEPLRDGINFLLIIFRIGTLYSPLKVFFPVSVAFFLTGCSYYLYTFLAYHRFTNLSALLFTTSVVVFLIGLVSEQITMLLYGARETDRD